MSGAETMLGSILNKTTALWFLGVWVVVVLIYGLWRSRGDAEPDPIRSSGPLG